MRRQECLKHLDQAFTEAPPELKASVEEAFRRGEEAMNQRHKIMTALSVAAAVAVLCAALALAAGTLLKPRRDNVVAARGRGESTPTHTPVPETTPQPEQALYYATKAGRYYHIDAHCGGMMNAMPIAESDALDAGKQPCPVCVTGEAVSEEYGVEGEAVAEEYSEENEVYNDSRAAVYYATMKGAYYHEDPHCSGMKGALPWTFEALWIKNEQAMRTGDDGYVVKQPCPVCTGWDPPVVNVYATAKGKYYHIDKNCSGMKSATRYYTSESAEEAGKTHCPVCLPDGDNLCWATSGGQYYHIKQECMGMKGARICMEASAQRQGKTPCPVCWKGDGRYDP